MDLRGVEVEWRKVSSRTAQENLVECKRGGY